MQVRYFAAAADAAGVAEETLDGLASIAAWREDAVARHGERFGQVLERCSLLADGRRVTGDDVDLSTVQKLDVLPPFAGG